MWVMVVVTGNVVVTVVVTETVLVIVDVFHAVAVDVMVSAGADVHADRVVNITIPDNKINGAMRLNDFKLYPLNNYLLCEMSGCIESQVSKN